MTLDEFLTNKEKWPDRAHVIEPGFSNLYVRKSRTHLQGCPFHRILDIADVNAAEPGNGSFTRLLDRLDEQYPEWSIYVENVMSKRFGAYLLRRHFIVDTRVPHCYFLP